MGAASPLHTDAMSDTTMSDTEAGPMRKFEPWLGHWESDYDHITDSVELVLQACLQPQISIKKNLPQEHKASQPT